MKNFKKLLITVTLFTGILFVQTDYSAADEAVVDKEDHGTIQPYSSGPIRPPGS